MPTSLLAAPRGLQTPRLRVAPSYRVSDGPDAIEFAAGYGLVGDPWQELVVTDWMALAPDGRWACPQCGLSCPRQNGKNGCLEIRELYGTTQLAERFLHTAHEVKTARKHFKRLLHFFDNPRKFPDLHDLVEDIRHTNGQEGIFLNNGGSVELAARSKGSGRGWSVDVLVGDEAQDLNDDELEALLPTISASDNPQLILTGTPPKPGVVAGEVFARMRQEALAA